MTPYDTDYHAAVDAAVRVTLNPEAPKRAADAAENFLVATFDRWASEEQTDSPHDDPAQTDVEDDDEPWPADRSGDDE